MVGDQLCESKEDIEFEIIGFYKQLYTGIHWDRPRPNGVEFKQMEFHKALLIEGSFAKEIKETVFGLGDDRALSPDGFPIVFFQEFS